MAQIKVWHPRFLEYMENLIKHKNYQGIPYNRNADGKIQWIAPKISTIGKKRIAWALNKAKQLGYKNEAGVYAKVMFHIHPSKEKPCQICGKMMSLRYIYLNGNFVKSLSKIGITCNTLNSLDEICRKIISKYGKNFLDDYISEKFSIPIECGEDIESIVNRCEEICRTGQCKLLGPGAMSNFPDRLDGFHTYNRCCRKKEDTGRHDDNMKTYNKDRRAYEYWSDGNIYAANKFMNSSFFEGYSADHIGPISLGFKHDSILLQKMSTSDNSSKRDRLLLEDIYNLIQIEKSNPDYTCASWFIQKIWLSIKQNISETLDLEKYRNILKENMFLFMNILKEIKATPNGIKFLTDKFLYPKYNDFNFDYTFNESGHILTQTSRRKTEACKNEYDRYQRIALQSIDEYISKNNRRIDTKFTIKENNLISQLKTLVIQEDFDSALSLFYKIMVSIQERLCCK